MRSAKEETATSPKYWFVGVSPDSLCNVLSILSKRDLAWGTLVKEGVNRQLFGLDKNNVDTIIHQHIMVARLLGLVNSKNGLYRLLAEGGRLLSFSDSEARNKFLRKKTVTTGISGNNPLRKFLEYFVGEAILRTERQFAQLAKPIRLAYYSPSHVEIYGKNGESIQTLSNRSSVSEVYWGTRPYCLAIELMGEVVESRTSRRKDSVLYALRTHAAVLRVKEARKLLLEVISQAFKDDVRIRIADLRKAVCVSFGLSPAAFDNALMTIHAEYPTEFYLDRIPSLMVKGREDEFVRVDGEWRSFLVLPKQSGHR
jgi:hypothetical protein